MTKFKPFFTKPRYLSSNGTLYSNHHDAMAETIANIFHDQGAVLSNPTIIELSNYIANNMNEPNMLLELTNFAMDCISEKMSQLLKEEQ